jgi:hypothetical protein
MIGDIDIIEGGQDLPVTEDTAINGDKNEADKRDELTSETSSSLKRKIQENCDSRKKLEAKLEQSRLLRQVQDYDFDDLDE